MASFSAKFLGNLVAEMVDDERAPGTLGPDDKGAPGRFNASDQEPSLHAKTTLAAGAVTVECRVGGVDAPLDINLDGKLFTATFAEWPERYETPPDSPPTITLGIGQSSLLTWAPKVVGHYVFVVYRDWGSFGRFFLHLDVE